MAKRAKLGTPESIALADACSTLQYVEDHGELTGQAEGYRGLERILTSVRYTDKMDKGVSYFDVVVEGRKIRFYAEDVGEAPVDPEDEEREGREIPVPENPFAGEAREIRVTNVKELLEGL